MSKTKIVVLSDIHIGTNAPTVWYQKGIHEEYLIAVLDWVIENSQSIRELILLGDIVDFWTYPPDEQPPSFDEIMAANPKIFSSSGKLSEVLTALEGKITYVRGNHDMTITQSDLDNIPNPNGYKITLSPDDIYYPLGNGNHRIVCTHGHLYTMFNAPYNNSNNSLKPLPLGQFITRAMAYKWQRHLEPGKTVADLDASGEPNGICLDNLVNSVNDSVAETVLNYIVTLTGLEETHPIRMANNTETSIKEAKNIYRNLWSEWQSKSDGITTSKSATADLNGTFMGWFAQKLAFEVGAELVIMGHTHKPISGLKDSLIKYFNTGFNCPSKRDLSKKHPTFLIVDTDDCHAAVFQVVKEREVYTIQAAEAEETKVAAPFDFSCYLIIDNTQGNCDLDLLEYEPKPKHGHYIVAPPQKISRGEQGRFWLQDYLGTNGSEGWAKYSAQGREINLTYQCPTASNLVSLSSINNNCSGANFYTKSGGDSWGDLNQVKKLGHPFFVKFVL
ncbi:metallophosphoesterase [Microcoleus sp. S13_C3]